MKKAVIFVLILLCACTDRYIGERKAKKALEGERIPVIEVKESFTPGKEQVNNIVLPKPQVLTFWPVSGGLAHHSVQHIASKLSMDLLYKKSIGSGSSYRDKLLGEPIVADDKIYTIDKNANVCEIDLKTGEILWSKRMEPLSTSIGHVLQGVGVSFDNDKLFVALGSGEIIAINTKTKEILWKKMLSSPLRSSPLIYGGRVYAQSVDNRVTALSSFNGDILWSHDFGTRGAVIMGVPSPAADMGVVIFGLSVGEVIALRSDNGNFLWRASLGSSFSYNALDDMRDIKGRIIIDNNKIYVTSNTKTSVLSLKNGAVIWEKDIPSLNSPALAGDYIFVTSTDDYLLTILEKTGETVAGIKLPSYEDEKDKTGKILWSEPYLVQDKLIVAGTNGEIRIYSPYTGKLQKIVNVGISVSIPMIFVKDYAVILGDNANLMVYK